MNKRQLRKTLRRVLKESKGVGCVPAAQRACASNPRCSEFLGQMNVTEVAEFWLPHVTGAPDQSLGDECHDWIENYLTECDGWGIETEAMIILWTVCHS